MRERSTRRVFDSRPRLKVMINPEYEKKNHKDQSGFSEKQLDIDVETGVFRKKKIKKTLFEKKLKK